MGFALIFPLGSRGPLADAVNGLIFSRLLDVVDDDDVHGAYLRFQFQAQLPLDSREYGGLQKTD